MPAAPADRGSAQGDRRGPQGLGGADGRRKPRGEDGRRAGPVAHHHRDLSADHLLVDPQTLGLTGVIDFEDAAVGDPAFDFTGLAGLGPGALDNYKGPSDAGFAERIEFYRRLVPLHELLYGIEEGLPERVAGGLLRLRRDLAGPA
ncbi:MAG: phosphotransferase [Bacillota bacterium]